METLGELGLAVDDVVVYGSHGVGRVAIRREQSVVVEFVNSGLTVTLPIERVVACVRPLSTEAEIASVGETLGGAYTDVHANWQRRLKATRAKVAGGEAVELAEVIRDASRREERAFARSEPGKLSLTERRLYLRARQLLADEIGASRGVDPADADEWIADRIAANADHERLPQPEDLTTLRPRSTRQFGLQETAPDDGVELVARWPQSGSGPIFRRPQCMQDSCFS